MCTLSTVTAHVDCMLSLQLTCRERVASCGVQSLQDYCFAIASCFIYDFRGAAMTIHNLSLVRCVPVNLASADA